MMFGLPDALKPILTASAALFVFFIIHLILWQFENIKNRGVFLIILVSAVAYVPVLLINQLIDFDKYIWVSCPLFMFFIMLYMHFYVGVDRSVSIRILGELLNTTNGKLELQELQEVYPQEFMIKSRLDLLVENNWLENQDGKYNCSSKAKYMVKSAIFLRKIYTLELTG